MCRCARCGRELDINEYVQNSRLLTILNEKRVLHFCTYCVQLVEGSGL